MNTSMFLPQVAEKDKYDANGNQVDDINSVVEYVAITLGYDHKADDEDDDTGQNFHLIKSFEFGYHQSSIEVKSVFNSIASKISYPKYTEDNLLTVSYDIIAPPPKA